MEFELVITNGTLIDGTGNPRFQADVGINNGKIAAISTGQPLSGSNNLDASGLIIAPGFIDIHSHSDWVLPLNDHDQVLAPMVLQGMTTLVAGNCGFSPAPITEDSLKFVDDGSEMIRDAAFPYRWSSMKEFLDVLEAGGLLLNAAFLVGHGTLRLAAMGDRAGPPGPKEMEVMRQLTLQAVRDGAFGLSTGLGYAPGMFASNEEILSLLKVVAEQGGIYTVHSRSYRWVSPVYPQEPTDIAHNRLSTLEQLELARKSGVRLQLSHLLFHGRRTWATYQDVIQDVEHAAAQGVDVAFDAFPYTYGNTTISVNFPGWFMDGFSINVDDPAALRRLKRELDYQHWLIGKGYGDIYLLWAGNPELGELEGLDFSTIAQRLRMPEFEAYMHVARRSKGSARILQDTYSGDTSNEEPLQAILEHPLCAFMLDSILTRRGKQNPASFGTFPRLLGRYSRDLKLFSLEEAIRRMTSYSADRMGITDIGRVKQGLWADLVLFDPEQIDDHTTLQQPEIPPSGIKSVLISGNLVAQDGQLVANKRWGRALRRS